jgi:alpha-L-rhamnosidase
MRAILKSMHSSTSQCRKPLTCQTRYNSAPSHPQQPPGWEVTPAVIKTLACVLSLGMLGTLQGTADNTWPPAPQAVLAQQGSAHLTEPYAPLHGGKFDGPLVRESPDPLVAYRWKETQTTDAFQIYFLKPSAAVAEPAEAFDNLAAATTGNPAITVKAAGSIRVDFGVESAAWVEFDSPDCPGDVEMGISEHNEPALNKTKAPVKHGTTYRLELNPELYDGLRFAWINIKAPAKPWHITAIRAVCQVKPTNYAGSFSCSDPLLTKVWYMSAYGVKASLCKDYFGSILMDRGDRMSWTGDAHTTQAAALVAFGNFDFIKQNIDNTSGQSNGIRSYSLYWVLSLLDYYRYTGDTATLEKYIANACAKLDDAHAVFGQNPKLKFYGWDERLCAGFEIWFKSSPEAQNAYKMLSMRAWNDFAAIMGQAGRADLRDKYTGYVREKMAQLRQSNSWCADFGLHAAADAINTGNLNDTEKEALFEKWFLDRVNRVSLSPFNQYFIIQAMARMGKHDDALSSVRDMWGGMVKYGATTTFEVYRPSWNEVVAPNAAVPNSQSGIVSLCHPWGAGVVKWLNEEVLGIVPTQAGFKTYDILPHPGRTLTRVSGESPTPLGNIRASFDLTSGLCSVSAPPGTLGRIGIPKAGKSITHITINGKPAWDGSYHAVPGIEAATQDAEFVYFTAVQPGSYALAVTYTGKTPAHDEPAVKYAAEALNPDTTTGGDWGGTYGNEGHILCNYHGEGRDEKSLPSYVTSLEYFRAFPKNGVPDPTVWATGTSDKRALAPNVRNSPTRNATCYSNNDQTMTVSIGIDGNRDYQVALYFVDWANKGSRMAVEMFDASTLNLVAPVKILNNPAGGAYLVYKYNRSAKFRINKVRGDIVSLSGIFFDSVKPDSVIKDYGLKDYVHVSKDLPHSEPTPWKLVCTLPYNCHFQPSLDVEAPAGREIRFNSSNPLVQYLTPTESLTTTAGAATYEAKNWVSGEGAVYTIPAGVIVKAVKYRETGYDTAFAGSFECNDNDYNILWNKAARTAYLCMRNHFYDCPDRERVGFWGDGTPEMNQCFYVFDSRAHRLAKDLVLRKLEPKFYPGQHLEFLGDYGLWFYYLQTGDLESMRAIYEPTKKFLFETYQFGNPRTWFDWGKEVKDTAVTETCFHYICLGTLKKIARVTGHEADIPAIDARLEKIQGSFDSQYWKGGYYMSTQVTEPDDRANAMAVNAGLADRAKWPAIHDNVLTKKTYASCFFDRWVFEALCTMGKQEYAMLRMYDRYKTMIPASFTTLWEHYDRWWASRIDAFDEGSSLNHGWNPPAILLSQTISGVSPLAPGWSTYQVMPKEAFLTSIKVVVPTIKGNITVDLRKATAEYALTLTSPAATTAIVGIPKGAFTKLNSITLNGSTIWDGITRGTVDGVTWDGEDANYVKFKVAPGTWKLVGHGTLPLTSPKPLPPPPPNDTPLDKKSWTASASVADGIFPFSGGKIPVDVPAANALDDDHWTGWRDMTQTQYPGQWFQVDMQQAQTFDKIVLDNTWALWDSPDKYAVAVSADGIHWGPPIATGSGQLGITTITFPTQTARHIRITQTGQNPKYHWSIYEFDVLRTH